MKPDISPERLDVERITISPKKLVGAEWNPNEMTADEFALLKKQISEVGFIKTPIVAEVVDDDGKSFYEIVAGHHRVAAAKELGIKKIPVDVLQGEKWQEKDLRKLQNVRMNVLHGNMNPEKMVSLYNEMVEKYGNEATQMLGYATDAGIKKLIRPAVTSQLTSDGRTSEKNSLNCTCPACHTMSVVISPKGLNAPPEFAATTTLIQPSTTKVRLDPPTAITTVAMSSAVVRLSATGDNTNARAPVTQNSLRNENRWFSNHDRSTSNTPRSSMVLI